MRKNEHTLLTINAVKGIKSLSTLKEQQKTRWLIGYYCSYADPVHAIVNRAINEKAKILIDYVLNLIIKNKFKIFLKNTLYIHGSRMQRQRK